MSDLALAGVFSSIDTDILVESMMNVARQPLLRLEARKADYQAKQAAVDEIERRLGHLKDLTEDLRGTSALRAVTASSSDTGVLTVTSSTGAVEGVHTVVVNQLARASTLVHTNGLASSGSLVGEGAFVYSYAGVTRTINTSSSTTLEDLQDLINNDAGNPGVTASVLEYGSAVHLVLTGRDTGDDYDITIDAATTLTDFESADFTETQSAQNAEVRVDGFPAGAWIERNSNSISDVIGGVTIDLKSTGTATVHLTRDTAQVKTDLNNLVGIYNGLVGVIDEYTGYDTATEQGGILQGDSIVNNILEQLRTPLITQAVGFLEGTETYVMAAQIGLEIDEDGLLSLDETIFDEALSDDYDAVLELVGALASGASDSSYIQFTGADATTAPGTYEVEVDFDGGGTIQVARIRASGESVWRYLDINGGTLTGATGNDEQGLELTAVWDGASSTQTATVRVQQGLASNLYDLTDGFLDGLTGAIAAKEDEFERGITQIDDLIEIQEYRLEAKEKVLRQKFARMEQALAQLDSLRASVQALVSSTNSSNDSDND